MDYEIRIIKGWLVGSDEEVERFHEATNYHYEDFIHSADCCSAPYFIGDEIGTIPAGCHMECDEMNMLMFKGDDISITNGVTDSLNIAEWRIQLANAGYSADHILFDKPRVYILSCEMY